MCKKLLCLTSLILLLGLAGVVQATTYYVSPSGNDNNAGTSTSTAWKTIAKVNSVTFAAGDSILFEGGQTFSGQLVFDNESGTSTSPITVNSYGTGRATLSNPTMGVTGSPSNGLRIYNCQGFNINNLILVGPGNVGDRWDENIGLLLYAHLAADVRLVYFRINNIEVSNYSGRGIYVLGDDYSGFRDVQITNCVFHHIGAFGINTGSNKWPMTKASHNDFYIADNTMYHITGVGTRDPHSGNGIVLAALNGALLEFNQVYSCGYNEMSGGGGPLGIWCWETENAVFQFNEVHHQQTLGGDGGGFDLDGGTSFGTMQYNYSHDNFGGDLLMQFGRSRPAHDYIYRYNTNANQGQLNNMGALTFYTDTGGEPYNVDVYNNTFYVGPDALPGASAVDIWYWKGGSYSNVNLRNNIFIAEAGKNLISYQKIAGITFQNNMYWQSGEPLVITDGTTTYTSLAAWRTATGQEMLSGSPVGYQLHPQLTDVHSRPALGPHNLANLTSYKLKSTSQCRDNGLNLQTLFGINPGTRDFYGSSIPQGSKFDISAHEYLGGGSAPAPDSTPPAAPTGLTATATSAGINLDWADNGEADKSHYSVKRSTTTGGPYTQIISNLNASTYSDRTIVPSTAYYYVVTATDTSSNQSGNSNQASATVTYPGVIIFSDGFESGNFTVGGWEITNNASVTTEAAYEGTYGATIGKISSIRKRLSTVGYTNIRIRYMHNTINSTRWGCTIAWWDGSNLHPIEISAAEAWGLKDIICGPEADNNPDFYIFFRDNDPGPSERAFVDSVQIWGIGGAPSDTTPPSPNPMTWATVPYATGSTSIAMTATTATDPSGVEYFFDCTTTGGHDSVWQDSTSYTDTGLSPGTTYTYRMQARDKSPNLNTTGWSTSQSATTQTGGDTTPPTPNPMTWATVPYATGSTSIAMVATTATDASGVEYFFDCTTTDGHDSVWQDSTSYTDTGLTPSTQYTYRVQARDKSVNLNATGWSTSQSATTQSGGGANLALNKPVTVSSIQSGSLGSNAVDGSLTTLWRSKKRSSLPSEWIKVDLGASYSISKVVLKWAGFWGTAYTIQVSIDDSTYSTVYTTTSGDGGDDVITFSSVSARYVIMNATGFYNNTERLYLNEYEVYQQ